jgi:methionine-R-sulfoxide reductase
MNIKYLSILLMIFISLVSCAQKNNPSKAQKEPEIKLSEKEWRAKLTPQQYFILREKGTERAFSGEFVMTKEKGTYKCAGCGEPLFTDEMKFESHCGWPSFDREVEGGKIVQSVDNSHGMQRIEITCAKCGGHLGHIFDDGPTKTGQRYCVNSLSLTFEPKKEPKKEQLKKTDK